ncbi:hypothetical protein HanXRQr2_Chr08g0350691 [Helianthus annuus]|uniref:Uncharacterized protein n=1 Tax=Helianthus annuus TaxID=4232 RepID=A0A9K3IG56_HELAN|nr:hypothetical protein HanXRQr2_Chr08g0350691 [Helianthus annuus]KAJ0902595.1 hypothetical protein HanPSC8_Chr08g0338831 [Helianthus annuus]
MMIAGEDDVAATHGEEEARRYADIPSLEDHPPLRRHVIVLPRMLHHPKLEGMRGWS